MRKKEEEEEEESVWVIERESSAFETRDRYMPGFEDTTKNPISFSPKALNQSSS